MKVMAEIENSQYKICIEHDGKTYEKIMRKCPMGAREVRHDGIPQLSDIINEEDDYELYCAIEALEDGAYDVVKELESMATHSVRPIDVGIWKFWMASSDADGTALYECEKCHKTIRSSPKMLPMICPECHHRPTYDHED